MHRGEKQGVRTLVVAITMFLVVASVASVALVALHSTAAAEQTDQRTVDAEGTPAFADLGTDSDGPAPDLATSTVSDIDGINTSEADRIYEATGGLDEPYQIEFEAGVTLEPAAGLDHTVLEVEYVFDELARDFDIEDLETVIATDLLDDEPTLVDEDSRLPENITIEPIDGGGESEAVDSTARDNVTSKTDRLSETHSTAEIPVESTVSNDTTITVDDSLVDTTIQNDSLTVEPIAFDQLANLSIRDDLAIVRLQDELDVANHEVPVMVQFEGGFDPRYIDAVESLGYRLTDDLADHTQYGMVPAENIDSLAALDFVRSVSQIHPETKLSPRIDETAARQSVVVSTFDDLAVEEFDLEQLDTPTAPEDVTDEELAILGVDRETYEFQRGDQGALYVGEVTQEQLISLRDSTVVRYIDAWEVSHTREPPQTTGGVEHTDLLDADNWDGSNTAVGVLDSGIEADHAHFDDTEVILSYDWTADLLPWTSGDSGEDNDGHGTHVAGIIAGAGEGHTGVAPETALVVSRVLDDPESVPEEAVNPQTWFTDDEMWVGPVAKPTRVFDKVAESAAAHGEHVDIMSNSWGYDWGSYDYFITGPTDGWANANPYTLQVTSNGNAADTSTWPAAGKNVLAVGGLDADHSLARQNDIRPPEPGQVKPDVNAPSCITSADIGHSYEQKCGTSMATPYVSGLAARYIGHTKAERDVERVRANEVKTALIASSTGQLNPHNYDGVGWGAVNDLKLYNLATTPNNQFSATVEDNNVNVHSFDVPEDAGHVEVTLSWSEKQNRVTTSFLRNDLHIYLTKEDADEVIEINERLLRSDEVDIDVSEPLQVDNSEDRTVRRVGIPSDNLEAGEWKLLVHAADTTWDSDHVLYDVAIDMQGDERFRVDGTAFEVPADGQETVRLDLHGGHSGDDAVGMIPQVAPGVVMEDLGVVGGGLCGWELRKDDTVLESGDAGDTAATVGTVTGANNKHLDVCVDPDGERGDLVSIDYEFSYIAYPDDRVRTPTATGESGQRVTESGIQGGVVRQAEATDDEGDQGGGGPGFTIPVVAIAVGSASLIARRRH